MGQAGLAFGLLDTTPTNGDPAVWARFRDLTIAWMRYSYRGRIIEGKTVTEILHVALESNYAHCLVLPYGSIIIEYWDPGGVAQGDFLSAILKWIDNHEYLVAGRIVGGESDWFGFDDKCLLIDLAGYRQLGMSRFQRSLDGPIELPKPIAVTRNNRITALRPSGARERHWTRLPGWPLIAACLEEGISVNELAREVDHRILSLTGGENHDRAKSFASYLGHGIDRFRHEGDHDSLDDDQVRFLDLIAHQTANARKGVFLWNIEPYADVESPPDVFNPPVSTLYSVAAGFKPNMILHTHGFDEQTRVVFFDYSPNALAVRRRMVEAWDGDDFPRFVQYLFREFPHPDTHYHLWRNLSCSELERHELDKAWDRELARWGGGRAFKAHWAAYRKLDHEYLLGNVLTEPSVILNAIKREPGAVIWWSNAFFTMFSNWFFRLDERRKFYESWIQRLAAIHPEILMYGSDYNNASVNCIQAGEYRNRYGEFGGNELNPCKLHRMEIRM
jgi:hypothetical protein